MHAALPLQLCTTVTVCAAYLACSFVGAIPLLTLHTPSSSEHYLNVVLVPPQTAILANPSTDRQLVNPLANSYDGQTIGQLTGEFGRRTDNWSTHWRICRRTDIRSTHWRFCTSHSISNIQNLFISTIHRPRPTAAPATACSPPPTSTPNINMISIIGWHGYGSIQR